MSVARAPQSPRAATGPGPGSARRRLRRRTQAPRSWPRQRKAGENAAATTISDRRHARGGCERRAEAPAGGAADERARVYSRRAPRQRGQRRLLPRRRRVLPRQDDRDSRALGLRALSNLAEIDLQNRQVLRLLAYRLQQAGEIDAAVPMFERVVELAPNEPQSHRDLGLALAEAGQAQARSTASTRSSPARGTRASPTST